MKKQLIVLAGLTAMFAACTNEDVLENYEAGQALKSEGITFSIAEGVERIEEKAFCLKAGSFDSISLPASLDEISIDAFPLYTKFKVESGSYAQRWAEENAFNYSINGEEQNLDWLNN